MDNNSDHAREWTGYWRERPSAHSACLPLGPSDVNRALRDHWETFANRLPSKSRIIDLACGSGAVAHLLAETSATVDVTGVDSAEVPPARSGRVSLRSGVRIEDLPFENASFDGAVSQFGIEYADANSAIPEVARVLRSGAPISLVVHHAGSPIVRHNRGRKEALRALTSARLKAAFLAADRPALQAEFTLLRRNHPGQDVIAEFAYGLGANLTGSEADRRQLWDGLGRKLALEGAILDALDSAAVSDIEGWRARFEDGFALDSTSVLNNDQGAPIAWIVTGNRR